MARSRSVDEHREPATIGLLAAAQRSLDFSSAHDRTLWGSAVVGYFFLLRGSEITKRDKSTQHAVQVQDVRFVDDKGPPSSCYATTAMVELRVRSLKTDQLRKGQLLRLNKAADSTFCPVNALWNAAKNTRASRLRSSGLIQERSWYDRGTPCCTHRPPIENRSQKPWAQPNKVFLSIPTHWRDNSSICRWTPRQRYQAIRSLEKRLLPSLHSNRSHLLGINLQHDCWRKARILVGPSLPRAENTYPNHGVFRLNNMAIWDFSKDKLI